MERKQIFGWTECRQPRPGEYVRYMAVFVEGDKTIVTVRNEKGEHNEIEMPELSARIELKMNL